MGARTMILNSPQQYVNYLCKHSISPAQFLFLYILYENDYASLYKYVNENGGFELKELKDLEERGYLINDGIRNTSWADNYRVTQKFIKELYNTDASTSYDEFFQAYPLQIYINGKKMAGRNATAKTRAYYKKNIAHKRALHDKVMKCLKWAKDNSQIQMGMEKWIETRQWKTIEELMKTNINEFESPNDKVY